MVKALICGGGNGAHVLAGLGSSQPDTEVRVFTMFADEAERWSKLMETSELSVIVQDQNPRTVTAKPAMVSKDPAQVVPGCDIIIIVVPAFGHQAYLDALKPYISPGVTVVAMPGQNGFEFALRHSWGDLGKGFTIINIESLPWAARIKEFGTAVEVLGTKATIEGAAQTGHPSPKRDPIDMLQGLIGPLPKLLIKGHLLGTTLMSMNCIIHPAIMYGTWRDWDGQGMDEAPLFYNGVEEHSAQLVSATSYEVLAIAKRIMELRPDVDLTNVIHIHPYYLSRYPANIKDKSSVYSCLRTNRAFDGLTHPMAKGPDGKLRPNFKFRYISEDIPYGLVVLRGIAEVVNVPTPTMDKVLLWAQEKMGKEYLVNGRLTGRDVNETRAPQRYGLTDIDAILG